MTLHIKYFGVLAENTGKTEEHINLTIEKVSTLRELLIGKYASLNNSEFKIAMNQEIAHEDATLIADAEIALLPPFSGG